MAHRDLYVQVTILRLFNYLKFEQPKVARTGLTQWKAQAEFCNAVLWRLSQKKGNSR
jgi:hypothetical protein